MNNLVDIKPAPNGDGFCLYHKSAPPEWFSQEHHAIAHAQLYFADAIVRVFASDSIIVRTIEPDALKPPPSAPDSEQTS
jgi:hypothetical protein